MAQAVSASSSTSRSVPGANAPPSTSSSSAHVDRFPLLPGPSTPAFRQPQRHTPWASGGGSGSTTAPSTATTAVASQTPVAPKKKGKGGVARPPPSLSAAAFPELPTAQPRAKPPVSGNMSLRHILGEVAPVGSAWRGGEVGVQTQVGGQEQVETTGAGVGAGKGKKGKGKQKQKLFTLGSFPT